MKKNAKISCIILCVIALFSTVSCKSITQNITDKTVENYLNNGDYTKAYKIATGSKKDEILAENICAVMSQESSDNMKNPSSFNLINAYYYPFINKDNGAIGSYVVLYLSGTNSYGGTITNYFVYTIGTDEEWNYIGSCSVIYEEDDDDLEDTLIKYVANSGIEKGYQLSREQVKRINNMFKADTLYKVKQISWNIVDTSKWVNA